MLRRHGTAQHTAPRSSTDGTCLSAAAAGESASTDDSSWCSTACSPGADVAQSRRRCGRGEPSPDADVGGESPPGPVLARHGAGAAPTAPAPRPAPRTSRSARRHARFLPRNPTARKCPGGALASLGSDSSSSAATITQLTQTCTCPDWTGAKLGRARTPCCGCRLAAAAAAVSAVRSGARAQGSTW
jgi:hypothetical protein